jgi:PadR family transcriptional regulator PadR
MIFQASATLLDACVLSVLREEDTYGYVLTHTLRETLGISESTLYPVLRRLQKDKLLSTYDQPHDGRNRRYYSITEAGIRQAEVYRAGWQDFKTSIEKLIMDSGKSGGAANE